MRLSPDRHSSRRRKEIVGNGVKITVELDPETSGIVATLVRQYATGSHSFKSLARWMTEQGYQAVRSVDIKEPWALQHELERGQGEDDPQ